MIFVILSKHSVENKTFSLFSLYKNLRQFFNQHTFTFSSNIFPASRIFQTGTFPIFMAERKALKGPNVPSFRSFLPNGHSVVNSFQFISFTFLLSIRFVTRQIRQTDCTLQKKDSRPTFSTTLAHFYRSSRDTYKQNPYFHICHTVKKRRRSFSSETFFFREMRQTKGIEKQRNTQNCFSFSNHEKE